MPLDWQAEKVDSTRMLITEGGIKDQPAFDKICANTTFENDSIEECALIANNSNPDLEKIRVLIASKGKILSQTALNALIRKRNALVKTYSLLFLVPGMFIFSLSSYASTPRTHTHGYLLAT